MKGCKPAVAGTTLRGGDRRRGSEEGSGSRYKPEGDQMNYY